MSCLHYCCYCCCYCCDQCCPHRKQKQEKPAKYPHVEYKPVLASQKQQEKQLSFERHYEFGQTQAELPFQTPVIMPATPITEQPRAGRPFSPYSPFSRSPSPSPVHFSAHRSTPEPYETISEAGTVSSIQTVVDSHPTVQFSLYYDIQRRVLEVHIQQAYNLPIVARGASTYQCSPFIVLFLLPNKDEIFESKTVQKNSNPLFDQMFEFTGLPTDIRKQTLLMRIYHHGRKNELIGIIALPLEEADLFGVSLKMRIDERIDDIGSESRGNILLSITHKPGMGALQGLVLRAKNLIKMNGTACPYVRVYLLHNGRRQHKWKSSMKRNTLTPIFNEAFRFDTSSMNIKNISLEILLMDHNRFSGDEVMGVVRIGENAPEETGQSHWNEILQSPDHAVSRWHAVWPITHIYDGSSDRESNHGSTN